MVIPEKHQHCLEIVRKLLLQNPIIIERGTTYCMLFTVRETLPFSPLEIKGLLKRMKARCLLMENHPHARRLLLKQRKLANNGKGPCNLPEVCIFFSLYQYHYKHIFQNHITCLQYSVFLISFPNSDYFQKLPTAIWNLL